MPTLSNRLSIHSVVASGGGRLDFSDLALPANRESAVETAATSAAITLGVTAQDIIDALGRATYWQGWRNAFTDVSGSIAATQGDPVAATKDYVSGRLATESNASLKPTLGANGLSFDGDRLGGDDTGFPVGNNDRIMFAVASAPDSSGTNYIISTGINAAFQRIEVLIFSDAFLVGYNGGNISAGTAADDTDYIIEFVNQSGSQELLINGVSIGTSSDTLNTTLSGHFALGESVTGSTGDAFDLKQIIITDHPDDADKLRHFLNNYESLGVL